MHRGLSTKRGVVADKGEVSNCVEQIVGAAGWVRQ
jgi:hypothetical protein